MAPSGRYTELSKCGCAVDAFGYFRDDFSLSRPFQRTSPVATAIKHPNLNIVFEKHYAGTRDSLSFIFRFRFAFEFDTDLSYASMDH